MDIQSKEELRLLLKKLHKEGLTILHITHDQREAFQLAERMAVMVNGQIIQYGKPLELCKAPASKFVADFIGFRNFFPVKSNNKNKLCIGENFILVFNDIIGKSNFIIIPEHAINIKSYLKSPARDNEFTAEIKEITYFPDSAELILDFGVQLHKTLHYPDNLINELAQGSKVQIFIDTSKIILM